VSLLAISRFAVASSVTPVDLLMVVVVLTNLTLLGASRLTHCVKVVAIQGVALGILPLLVHDEGLTLRLLGLAIAVVTLKGFVFPWLLTRALREADVRREAEPFVGYSVSLLLGVGLLAVSLWIGSRLPLPGAAASVPTFTVPVALSTLLSGLLILVARRSALNQVLGYLVFENGIYAFGVPLVKDSPLLVEMGVLLDVFVGVFVMGIALFHIQRELKHLDADRLSTLKDSEP
jgi:hydrogenase-4 component E